MEKTLKLSAIRVANQLDIPGIKDSQETKPLADGSSELFYSLGTDQYSSFFNYGVIVFCGYSEEEINLTVRNIQPPLKFPEAWRRDNYSLKVVAGAELKFDSDTLTVDRLDDTMARIIMRNIAQSVALDHYNKISDKLVKEIKVFTGELQSTGKLSLNRKNMLKFIGRALTTQNDIADNIYIFNAAGPVWIREDEISLSKRLAQQFDLKARSSNVEHALLIIQSNLDAFTEISNQTESNRLEWIIIILILIEVFDTLIMKFL